MTVGKPDVEEGFDTTKPTTPHECRLRDLNYSAPISVDVEYTKGTQRTIKKDVIIGRCAVLSIHSPCHHWF